MVLITENGVAGGVLLVKDHQHSTGHNHARDWNDEESSIQSSTSVEPTEDSYYADDEDHHPHFDNDNDDEDDDVYQEFEELDFSELPDTKSILSDDSFYPPDDSLNFEKCQDPESPEPISFFKACCSNNAIIVKIMIRQGVTEEEVREMDKNNRVSFVMVVKCLFSVPPNITVKKYYFQTGFPNADISQTNRKSRPQTHTIGWIKAVSRDSQKQQCFKSASVLKVKLYSYKWLSFISA